MIDRPAGMLGNSGVFIMTQLLQHGQEALIAAIGHGDGHVSAKTAELGALHWRGAEDFAELFQAEVCQPFKIRIDQVGTWLKFRRFGGRSLLVPGTYILADIATEDLPPHVRAELLRNRAAQLDGQVRDTSRRIHLIGSREGFGGASIETARAGTAAIRGGRSGVNCREVSITPRKSHDPNCSFRTQVFLPIQPMPAYLAKMRSMTGPVST